MKKIIETHQAPQAIGPYSQAIVVGNIGYVSGQIALDSTSMEMIDGGIAEQTECVLLNLKAVCEAAGGNLGSIVKLNIYLINMDNFALVNESMQRFFSAPFPARATVEVSRLPKDALIEMDATLIVEI